MGMINRLIQETWARRCGKETPGLLQGHRVTVEHLNPTNHAIIRFYEGRDLCMVMEYLNQQWHGIHETYINGKLYKKEKYNNGIPIWSLIYNEGSVLKHYYRVVEVNGVLGKYEITEPYRTVECIGGY